MKLTCILCEVHMRNVLYWLFVIALAVAGAPGSLFDQWFGPWWDVAFAGLAVGAILISCAVQRYSSASD